MRYSSSRVGEIYNQLYGYECMCVEYISSRNITIKFLDDNEAIIKEVIYSNFKNGRVKNPYHRSICDVGYLGSGFRREEKTEAYTMWVNMLNRCYQTRKGRRRDINYIDCFVCDEWHNFQNFVNWHDDAIRKYNANENFCIDKDLVIKNNKIYCPDKCCLLPSRINIFLTTTKFKRGDFPIGVYYDGNSKKYRAQCCDPFKKRNRNLGRFENIDDAFIKYKQTKELYSKELAKEYNGIIDDRAIVALLNFKVDEGD